MDDPTGADLIELLLDGAALIALSIASAWIYEIIADIFMDGG